MLLILDLLKSLQCYLLPLHVLAKVCLVLMPHLNIYPTSHNSAARKWVPVQTSMWWNGLSMWVCYMHARHSRGLWKHSLHLHLPTCSAHLLQWLSGKASLERSACKRLSTLNTNCPIYVLVWVLRLLVSCVVMGVSGSAHLAVALSPDLGGTLAAWLSSLSFCALKLSSLTGTKICCCMGPAGVDYEVPWGWEGNDYMIQDSDKE